MKVDCPLSYCNFPYLLFPEVFSFSQVTTEFEEQWTSGNVEGWENESQENGHAPDEHPVIDLGKYSTVEELIRDSEVGPEKLKKV